MKVFGGGTGKGVLERAWGGIVRAMATGSNSTHGGWWTKAGLRGDAFQPKGILTDGSRRFTIPTHYRVPETSVE